MNIFEKIYAENSWVFGSGHGSLPKVTKNYRAFLEMFIRENNILHVIDYGCGDWQFSKLINWGKTKYTGIDIVQSVVDHNNDVFGSQNVSFIKAPSKHTELPKGDLLICKDVLQHWPNKNVQSFVDNVLPKYKYVLITNCITPAEDVNTDIKMGGFRPLDLRAKPFGIDALTVHTIDGKMTRSRMGKPSLPAFHKAVLLITN